MNHWDSYWRISTIIISMKVNVDMSFLPHFSLPFITFLDLNISSNLVEGEDFENFSDIDTEMSQ